MKILLLAGKAGAGKDTAADIICKKFNSTKLAMADPLKELAAQAFGFDRVQLWGPSQARNKPDDRFMGTGPWARAEDTIAGKAGQEWVRTACSVCGKDPQTAHVELVRWFYRLQEECGLRSITPRMVLQRLGTEYGRVFLGPNVWIDLAVLNGLVTVEQSGAPFVIVTDGRFPNEASRVRARGGRVMLLKDPSQKMETFSSHESERGLDTMVPEDFDSVVENDKRLGMERLERKLITAVLFLKAI